MRITGPGIWGPPSNRAAALGTLRRLPEIGVNVGYDVTPRLRVQAGYTFLYLSNVVRPGDATIHNGAVDDVVINYSATAGSSISGPIPD